MFAALVIEQDPVGYAHLPAALMHWSQVVGALSFVGILIWCRSLPFLSRSSSERVLGWETVFSLFLAVEILMLLGFAALNFLGENAPPGWKASLLMAFLWWECLVGPFFLYYLPHAERERIPKTQRTLFLLALAGAMICYAVFGAIARVVPAPSPDASAGSLTTGQKLWVLFLTAGGGCALFAACLPILRNLHDVRARRVWALARLSFKEAIRRRTLYAVCVLLVFFLFYNWYKLHKKTTPDDELRGDVQVAFDMMTYFLLLIAVVIAAFSIPRDIRQQTIHTIVTKPVERFEIVLGRFLGYSMLMTLVVFFMATLSLLYIIRGIDPDAAAESLKARDALYGNLSFEGTHSDKRGDNVGHEWEYRSYIAGPMPGQRPQYAIWAFDKFPANFTARPTVRCEFTFDIYRTTKGEENVGIRSAFVFTSWRYQRGDEEKYRAERLTERGKTQDRLSDAAIDNELAKKYGYYEIPSTNVTDNHTMTVHVPGGLFEHAAQRDDVLKKELQSRNLPTSPVQVRVKCNSSTQYLGMAQYDLYFRADNPDDGRDRLWFAWNFYKAAAGLWLLLCMATGLAVVLSTYLSGVISLLTTKLLLLFGVFVPFIEEVSTGKNIGGGPFEAALRLGGRYHQALPLEQTTINKLAMSSDDFFRIFFRGMLNIIPDVYSTSLSTHVGKGFNIGPEQLLVTCIMTFGYVLPWLLLGYYLLKWREIASAD